MFRSRGFKILNTYVKKYYHKDAIVIYINTSNIEMRQLNHSEGKHSLRIKGEECGNNECSN